MKIVKNNKALTPIDYTEAFSALEKTKSYTGYVSLSKTHISISTDNACVFVDFLRTGNDYTLSFRDKDTGDYYTIDFSSQEKSNLSGFIPSLLTKLYD